MSNELLFIIQTIIGLAFTLVAFSMGRDWLYGYIAVCRVGEYLCYEADNPFRNSRNGRECLIRVYFPGNRFAC